MDKKIAAIIARETGQGEVPGNFAEDEFIEEENEESSSDAYTDADAREELIEMQNDTIDTLVDEVRTCPVKESIDDESTAAGLQDMGERRVRVI